MSFFGNLFGGDAEKEAADKNRAAYADYLTKSQGYLGTGLTNAMGAYGDAKNDYAGLSALGTQYGAGTNMYLNALGLNGASGNAAASSAFTTSPGYQQGIDAGIDVLNRRRAAAGMAGSGNADLDALTFGQNAQNQQYNGWLDRLSGVNSQNASVQGAIASGTSGIDAARAGAYSQNASDLANLQGTYTSGVAGANTLEAQGKANGAKNLLGAGLGLAGLAAGGLGGSFGGLGSLGSAGSSLGSSLGSLGFTYGLPGTRNSNLYGPVA